MKTFIFLVLLMTALLSLSISCSQSTQSTTTSKPPVSSTQPVTTSPMGQTSTTPQIQKGGTMKIITTLQIPAFMPPVETTASIYPLAIHGIWDTLINYDSAGKVLPGLATLNLSADGKTMTFSLKKGVKFHDGTDFTADAVKYHIQNFKFLRARFNPITSMDIPDPYTIVFNLSAPTPALVYDLGGALWGAINSPTAVQKPTTDDTRAKDHIAGAGPFSLIEWKRDYYIKMQKFANYWDPGKPYLDALEIDFRADATTAVMSFRAGEAQVIRDLTPKDGASLKDLGFNILTCQGYMYVLCPDSKNADSPWSNLKVRQALEYAIDKQAIVNTFGYGFISAQYQASPQTKSAYVAGLPNRTYDVAKAKQLMSEAGYANGFDTTIFAQTSDDQQILTSIQNYLSQVGIRAKIDVATAPKFMEQGTAGWKNGLRYYYPGIDINPINTYNAFYSREAAHFTAMDKPVAMMDTIAQAYHEPDLAKQATLLQSVDKTLYDNSLVIPLWTWPLIAATDKSVHDLDLFQLDLHHWTAAASWMGK